MWIIRTSAWVRGAQRLHQLSVSSMFPKCVPEITLSICPLTKDTDAKEYCLAAAPVAASCLEVQPRTTPTALNLCNGQRVLAAIQNEICTRAAALSHLHDSHPSSTLASNSFLTLNLKMNRASITTTRATWEEFYWLDPMWEAVGESGELRWHWDRIPLKEPV